MGRWVVVGVLPMLLLMFGVLWPDQAEACACCDGHTKLEVKAWSNSGGTLVVDVDTRRACEKRHSLQLWRTGRATPKWCYDRLGNEKKKVACEDVPEADTPDWTPKSVDRVLERFEPAMPLASRYVRARRRIATKANPDELFEDVQIAVEVWDGRSWREVWRADDVMEVDYVSPADDGMTPMPVHVTIWPNPQGNKAALIVGNRYTDPGTGHYLDDLHWIALPPGVADLEHAASDPWAQRPVQRFDSFGTEGGNRRASALRNSAGLRWHRVAEFAYAAEAFTEALRHDPRNAMARYNLACAFARLGFVERAIGQLQELRDRAGAADCPKCAARIERARKDEDFDAIRSHPAFEAVVAPL